ncbi:MAG TPA: DNA translocase FtsK [Spirochaetaceae bacterium]|nr:DNA translocase FtsK [Spirochaetaceae bacterium]
MLVGAILALLGFALFALLLRASFQGVLNAGSLSGLLLGGLSWAAFMLPAFLWFASLILFLPGFRRDLLFLLVGALLPFASLAGLARFLDGPERWFLAWPSFKALGTQGTMLFWLVLALGSSLGLLALRRLLFGRGAGVYLKADRSLPARGSGPASAVSEERRWKDLWGQDKADAQSAVSPTEADTLIADDGHDATGARQTKPGVLPAAQSASEDRRALREFFASQSTDDEGAAVAPDEEAAELLDLDARGTDGGEEPIPVLFGRMEDSPPLETAEPSEDPAGSDEYWMDAELEAGMDAEPGSDADAIAPRQPAGHRAPLMGALEVFPDGEHRDALRTGQKAAPKAAARSQALVSNTPSSLPKPVPGRPALKPYAVPTDGILLQYPDGQYWIIDEKTKHAADVLRETLKEFNIAAEVTGIRKGPVITMFEILPAPGVRLSKIANLSDNIALRLAASSVRIVAPIPGKHAVGIEVPNDKRNIVSFREIVENEVFSSNKMEVPVVLGKDITGDVQVVELTQTPHLLIAGATGSGKSVCVNSIILSILYRRSFNEVKLILIDPKIVELKLYNGIPHLLTPVITEPKKAFQALQYCICEMERRYSLLDAMGVRDIRSYNRKIIEKTMATDKLPYIVVVIDEFADLMATTGKELESTLARLAAMSRAVGIHLVLATQRPSIDVITGLIKANIPSRIAFMVASKFDSRIIIDMVGAEKLLGRGDMLYSSATDAFPTRMQGAFVSDDEVERVVAYVKTLGTPDYIDDEIFIDDEDEDEGPSLFDEDEDDPLFEKALEIVLSQGKASASYLQRKLKIGYNRAARIVELMEEKGIVGKAQGSKPRDLMRNPELGGLRPPNPKARYVPDFSEEDEAGDDAVADVADADEPDSA